MNKYIIDFDLFDKINEINITPIKTDYKSVKTKSLIQHHCDYVNYFTVNEHNYIIHYFYYVVDNVASYQLLFTTLEQYNEYKKEINVKPYNYEKLRTIVEKETKFNDIFPIMKAISYIIFDFYPRLSNLPLSLGDTDDKVKINLYRNIIKNSFPNISETIGVDTRGELLYYYKIN